MPRRSGTVANERRRHRQKLAKQRRHRPHDPEAFERSKERDRERG